MAQRTFYTTDTGYLDVAYKDDADAYFDPDSDATFYVEVYDADDVLQDTFTLSTTPAITQISTGKWKIEPDDLTGYAAGAAYAKWYAKKDGVAIQPYPYIEYWGTILESPTGYNLCSLADVKTHLEITDDTENAFLNSLILRVSAFIKSYCQREFASQEFSEFYSGDGTNELMLTQRPLIAVGRVQDYYSGNAAFDYMTDDLHVAYEFESFGLVTLLEGDVFLSRPPGNYRVLYTAGYAAIPEDVRQVAIELVAQKYYMKDKQRAGIQSTTFAGQTTQYRKDDLSPAQKLTLQPYRRIVIGAA